MSDELFAKLRTALASVALEASVEGFQATVPAVFPPPFSTMAVSDWRRAIELWRGHAADLLGPLPTRPCPACGGSASRWLFESYDAHPYHECATCRTWFVPKIIEWSVFERLFERSPEARTHATTMMAHRDEAELREVDTSRIGGYLDELLQLLPSQGGAGTISYLDAGCGVGHSLRAAASRGLVAQGVDVDDAAVGIARANGLRVAYSREMGAIVGPYDLVSFWETLEHIATPLETLREFASRLADDGLIAITVPNRNAPAIRAMREASPFVHGGYNTPGHVNLFHPGALERLLARAGLTMLDADGRYGGNPVELAAYFLGETGGAFDFLGDPAIDGSIPQSLAQALTSVLPSLLLFERMALLSPILFVVACRQGRERVFRDAIEARRTRRREQLAAEARTIIAGDEAAERRLQDEINRRDELLGVEIGKRDQLLRDQERHLQGEIQRRDRLLAEAQERWDSRLTVRIREKIGRMLGMS